MSPRRALIVLAAVIPVLVVGASTAIAYPAKSSTSSSTLSTSSFGTPFTALPNDWIVYSSNQCPAPTGVPPTCKTSGTWEIYARDPITGTSHPITSSPYFDSWWPKLSPDRTKIMFHRTDAGLKDVDFGKNSLWVVPVATPPNPSLPATATMIIPAAAGLTKPATPFAGWIFQAHAEWRPQQDAIAILAATSTQALAGSSQIYVVPFNFATNVVGTPYQVTHGAGVGTDRPGGNIDPSWTPDGNSVLFVGCAISAGACISGRPQELVVTPNNTLAQPEFVRTNTTDGTVNFDPYFSPDGGRIAWLHQVHCNRWSIQYGSAANVTLVPIDVINDGAVNSKPAWHRAGQTIFFHRYPTVSSEYWQVPTLGGTPTQYESGLAADTACSADGPTNVTPANPAVPLAPAPRIDPDEVVFASSRCQTPPCKTNGRWQIFLKGPSGSPQRLTNDATHDSFAPRVSPNGAQILFYRTPGGQRADSTRAALWVMNADGSSQTKLIRSGLPTDPDDTGANPKPNFGWVRHSHAGWAPAGTAIVLDASTFSQESAGIVATGKSNSANQIYGVGYIPATKSVTSSFRISYGSGPAADRPGNNIDPSWNADGGSVLFTGCALVLPARTACDASRSPLEIVLTAAFGLTGEVVRTTTTDGTTYHDPVLSPNLQYIVAAHQLSCADQVITRMNADGSSPINLTTAVAGNASHPQWSPNSLVVYYDRFPSVPPTRPTVWSVLYTGAGLTELTGSSPCASDYPDAGGLAIP